MATDDVSTTSVPPTKRPISRKHRIHSHSPSAGKRRTDEFRINRTLTATNRSSFKLPNLLAKINIHSSTTEATPLKQYCPQQREPIASASSKLERQSTTINSQPCLPTLYSLTSNYDQKGMSEFRRKQIYALNHLMRDLEQEQFRQFCTVSTDKQENTEGTNKDLLK